MQYLWELPKISSISVDGDVTDFEFEEKVVVPVSREESIVLVGRFCDSVVISVGKIVEDEDLPGPELWTRLKIKGHTIQFTI